MRKLSQTKSGCEQHVTRNDRRALSSLFLRTRNSSGDLSRVAYNGALVPKFNESLTGTLRPGEFDQVLLKSDNRAVHSAVVNQPGFTLERNVPLLVAIGVGKLGHRFPDAERLANCRFVARREEARRGDARRDARREREVGVRFCRGGTAASSPGGASSMLNRVLGTYAVVVLDVFAARVTVRSSSSVELERDESLASPRVRDTPSVISDEDYCANRVVIGSDAVMGCSSRSFFLATLLLVAGLLSIALFAEISCATRDRGDSVASGRGSLSLDCVPELDGSNYFPSACELGEIRVSGVTRIGVTRRDDTTEYNLPFPATARIVLDCQGLCSRWIMADEGTRGANEGRGRGRRWLLAQRMLKRMGCGRRCHDQA
ncbi:hypothetical protein DBV15_08472 [Temnothorax longispinosus]|uniref:Uncharacterized protein n=1 Tax=Temnothorax longispinosus TaxID=300112 RepID=A0A4S2KQB4_9HYME|nr:hypothetical protein DBV15_08472 [Temnothorax longispinosus]